MYPGVRLHQTSLAAKPQTGKQHRRKCQTSSVSTDPQRQAAIAAALEMIEPGMNISLGSGRAVFGLAEAIGKRWPDGPPLTAVVASELTRNAANSAGIETKDLDNSAKIDIAFDGADEVDHYLQLIKGLGAALLREKLVLEKANEVVIMVQQDKLVSRLGEKTRLPVEIVRFGYDTTIERLQALSPDVAMRKNDDGALLVTDEGNYIADIVIAPDKDIEELALRLKVTLGVIEHGLFLDQTTSLVVGREDGTAEILSANR